MSLGISYMGTKRHLVPNLMGIVSSCRSGAFLDVFSGMCSVGRAVATRRQVWSNDLQSFSQLVASTHFCSQDAPLSRLDALGLTAAHRRAKTDELSNSFSALLALEHAALEKADIGALASLFEQSVSDAQTLTGSKLSGNHDLFCRRYAGTYFGYQQAIEIDSIRYALDCLLEVGSITADQWKAMLVALCMAMSRCSNSTGHFAQSLFPKSTNIKKVSAQRRRSIAAEWLTFIDEVKPIGNKEWRQHNFSLAILHFTNPNG